VPPVFLISALISTFYGAVFHVWRGGNARRLALFLSAGWIGFGLGQLIGALIGWNIGMLGEVHLIEASAGSLIALLIVNRPAA